MKFQHLPEVSQQQRPQQARRGDCGHAHGLSRRIMASRYKQSELRFNNINKLWAWLLPVFPVSLAGGLVSNLIHGEGDDSLKVTGARFHAEL